MNRLEVQIQEDGSNAVVRLSGMADMEAAQGLQQQLIPVVKGRASLVVLDLSKVDYMTSVALGILFWFNGQLKAQGRTLRVAAFKPPIAQVLESACVHRAMPVFKSVSEALTTPVQGPA